MAAGGDAGFVPEGGVTARPSSLCQLARDWQGEIPEGGAMVESKVDGWRFLWIDGQAFTRNGIPFRGISHIERAMRSLEAQFGEPTFMDGEFVVGEGLHTLAQTKAHQERGWKGGDAGTVQLFDALPMAAWKADDHPEPLYARKKALTAAIARLMASDEAWEAGWSEGTPCPIRVCEDQWAFDMADAEAMAREVWAAGGEGIVVKDPEGVYRRNRNSAWLKYRRDIEKRIAA